MPTRRTTDSMEQTIRVEIYNQTYSIRSDGDNEYILRLAEYVDQKMREISSGTLTVDSLKVAILAALHIADELHQHKHQHAQTDAQLASQVIDGLAEANAGRFHYEENLTGPLALVMGSEGYGVSHPVAKHCDFAVKIPLLNQD